MKKLASALIALALAAPLNAATLTVHVDGPGVLTINASFAADPSPTPAASPSPSPIASPTAVPTPAPTAVPTPTPVTPPVQTGAVPAGATITPQWMDHLSGYWHSSRLGNSAAIDDQKCYLQIAVAQPFQHKAVLDFWVRTNVDPETSNLNIKFPIRSWSSKVGTHNDYVGHTLNQGAMQWTCEAANSATFSGTYGYFDWIKTPGSWQHVVATWDYDAKTFTLTMNGVVADGGPFTNVVFGAADRDQYDMQLVVANPNSSACLPPGSYFDVRDDYSLTGN